MKINQRSLKISEELWERAQDTILSGCQLYSKGPETHIKGVSPIYIDHGKDGHVWDPDGNEYIDYDMGLGPILLGYQYNAVDDAVLAQLHRGMGYSLVAPEEVEYAELCVKHIPSAGKVRFLKTGSSATEAAVRIARCYTGRKHIVRGEYHDPGRLVDSLRILGRIEEVGATQVLVQGVGARVHRGRVDLDIHRTGLGSGVIDDRAGGAIEAAFLLGQAHVGVREVGERVGRIHHVALGRCQRGGRESHGQHGNGGELDQFFHHYQLLCCLDDVVWMNLKQSGDRQTWAGRPG